MIHLAVIGAGQLGSRHLQALALIEGPKRIFVIDPSEDSLEVAKQRYAEVSSEDAPEFLTTLPSLRDPLDLAIIATSANHRLSALESLYQACEVRNVVLEKVLFQRPEEYAKASELLENKNTRAWVNCPRRMFPVYQDLQKQLAGQKIKSAKVSGSSWGLACNAIHYIDLFNYLSQEAVSTVSMDRVDQVFESKRERFYEIFGAINCSFSTFDLLVSCGPGDLGLTIEVELEDKVLIIDEIKQTYRWQTPSGSEPDTEYQVLYQSQLSHKVFEDIQNNQCQLTEFSTSKGYHLKYINALIPVFRERNLVDHKVCPIT